MPVVGGMAANTRAGRFPFACGAGVATCTECCLVGAEQGKSGFGMIEADGLPVLRCVAIGACSPICAFVHIVGPMARDAGRWRRIGLSGAVAFSTFGARMFADETEASLIMIEAGLGPAIGAVTRCAIGAETALMRVIGLVAVDAFGRQAAPDLVFVAGETGNGAMFSEQWKVGAEMIELDCLPGRLGMTIGAGRA